MTVNMRRHIWFLQIYKQPLVDFVPTGHRRIANLQMAKHFLQKYSWKALIDNCNGSY